MGLAALNLAAWGVLGFYRGAGAAPPAKMPFANSIEQRNEIVQELREIKELIREQNALLRGKASAPP
jgi:hypothetical protein